MTIKKHISEILQMSLLHPGQQPQLGWGRCNQSGIATSNTTCCKGTSSYMATKKIQHTEDHLCQSNLGKQWDHRFGLIFHDLLKHPLWFPAKRLAQETSRFNSWFCSPGKSRLKQPTTANRDQAAATSIYPSQKEKRNRILFVIAAPKIPACEL